MEKTKKMTKREMFEQIKANYSLTTAEVEFIDHEIELLARKNSTEKKPTAKQTENEGIKQNILEVMENGRFYTVTELQKACGIETNQRASALLRQLIADGKVARTEDKRKAYFSKVAE
jgi:predicted transcriptional regulator